LPRVNSATEESQPVHCEKEMLHGVYTEYGECVQHDKPIFEITSIHITTNPAMFMDTMQIEHVGCVSQTHRKDLLLIFGCRPKVMHWPRYNTIVLSKKRPKSS